MRAGGEKTIGDNFAVTSTPLAVVLGLFALRGAEFFGRKAGREDRASLAVRQALPGTHR
jgi:hypothetical protein